MSKWPDFDFFFYHVTLFAIDEYLSLSNMPYMWYTAIDEYLSLSNMPHMWYTAIDEYLSLSNMPYIYGIAIDVRIHYSALYLICVTLQSMIISVFAIHHICRTLQLRCISITQHSTPYVSHCNRGLSHVLQYTTYLWSCTWLNISVSALHTWCNYGSHIYRNTLLTI